MVDFLTALITSSISMSAIILLFWLINKLLGNKLHASSRYYIWLVILVGLLIPIRPKFPVSFQFVQIPLEVVITEIPQAPLSEIPAVSVDTAKPITPVPYSLILFAVWVAGVLTVLAFHIRLHCKFISSIQRWGLPVNDNRVLSVLTEVCKDMKLTNKKIILKSCVFISSPMLVGFRIPTILLPENEISQDELEYIFRHELTHYRHKDLWVNIIVLMVLAMHWFNPFVYLMAKLIRTDCEAACDESVVFNKEADKRKRYGETIIGFVGAKNNMVPILSTYFYRGSNSMKKRLFSIMDTSKKRKGISAVCAMMLVVLTLLSGSVFASTSVNKYIDQDMAKSIALKHAGITEVDAVFIKTHLDYEDGRIIYDVEFYSGNVEYDYEIDAITGIILEYDRDIEYYTISATPSSVTTSQGYITQDEAKSIALKHAGIAEADAVFIKAHLDYDDGRIIYEVEFYSGDVEYDYEIDALTGTILEYDKDIEYFSINKNTSTQSTSEKYIGEAMAKSIALSAAGISESQAGKIKVELDREDGKIIYEVEFKNKKVEYEYEIDAFSGAILKVDIDYD